MPRIEVHDVQADFIECSDRFTAYIGGIGSGKTYAGALKALKHARRGTVGLVVAPTYPMLRDATLRTFLELAADAAALNRSEMRVALANGAEILFRSADNPDRLRGPNIHWAWLDEGAMCEALAWDVVIGRLRADGTAGPCWITSTPRGRNWLYNRLDSMRVFKSRTRDNPYLSPAFVQSLVAEYAGLFAAQELDAEFVSFEGLVYDMFDRNVHRQERDGTEIQRWLLGVDEGFTNPAVLLAVGVDGDGRLHISEEWYERQRLQEDHVAAAAEMHQRYRFEAVYVDRSAPGLIAALHKAGLPTREHGAKVLEGIREVQNYLAIAGDGRPRLTLSPSCANTLSEFESYVWAERGKAGDKRQVDEPEKVNDHAMDALRYVVCALRKPRYVEINIGKPAFHGGR